MNTKEIASELKRTLLRYKAGMISLEQAKQEQAFLLGLIKAYELSVLEEKVDRLEAAMELRR